MAKALAQLNWLDALYWALLLFPIVFGMLRGFVRQIVPLVGLFVAFTLAGRYYPLVHARLVGRAIESAQVGQAVSFGIVFLLVSIVFSLLSVGLDRLVKVAMLGWLNRSLGAAVGLLKGGVYVLILAYGVVMFAPKDKPAVKTSRWTPAVVEFAETTLWPMIPEADRKTFAEKKDKLLAFLKDEGEKAAEAGKDAAEKAVERATEAAADKAGAVRDAAREKAEETAEEAAEGVRRVVDEALPTRR